MYARKVKQNMRCWKKLKFWRRTKKYVTADSHEQTEKRLRDIEATLAAVEEEMKHRNSEYKKLEATLCSRIVELEESVRQKEEVVATLRDVISEFEEKFDDCERMKIVSETQRRVRKVERDLRVHIYHCQTKLNDNKNYEMKAAKLDPVEELNEDLEEEEGARDMHKETLHGQVQLIQEATGNAQPRHAQVSMEGKPRRSSLALNPGRIGVSLQRKLRRRLRPEGTMTRTRSYSDLALSQI
jgi:hypothetical protein